ncbi:nardilysin-like isoform X2 [Arapaima gigas]
MMVRLSSKTFRLSLQEGALQEPGKAHPSEGRRSSWVTYNRRKALGGSTTCHRNVLGSSPDRIHPNLLCDSEVSAELPFYLIVDGLADFTAAPDVFSVLAEQLKNIYFNILTKPKRLGR